MALQSKRSDGYGHWPRGKRRSDVTAAEQRQFLAALQRALETDGSIRAVARKLKRSDRSLRRWLSGEDWPTRQQIARCRRLLLD